MSSEAQAHVTSSSNSREVLSEDAELDRRILANRQRVLTELAQEEALSANAREKALS
jgi:hypothetical protein